MITRIIILNLVLVILMALGAARFRQEWLVFESTHPISAIQPAAETLPALPAGTVGAPGPTDWTEIPSRNPFSFDRNDVATVQAVPAEAAPPSKPLAPKPILFGTISLSQGRVAMVGPAKAKTRPTRPTKVGETVDEWTVVEIREKSIVIESNGVRETVTMNDPWVEVPRDHTRTVEHAATAPAVVQTGPAEPGAAATARTPAGQTPPAGSDSGPGATGQRMEEIRTPFGVVRRPVQDPRPN